MFRLVLATLALPALSASAHACAMYIPDDKELVAALQEIDRAAQAPTPVVVVAPAPTAPTPPVVPVANEPASPTPTADVPMVQAPADQG